MAQDSSEKMDVSGLFFKVSEYFFRPRKKKKRNSKKMICKKASPKNGGVDDIFLFLKGMMFMEPFRIYLVYTCSDLPEKDK